MTTAENDRTTNNTRDFYRTITLLKDGFSARNYGIKDKQGVMVVMDRKEGAKVWRNYFDELLNWSNFSSY